MGWVWYLESHINEMKTRKKGEGGTSHLHWPSVLEQMTICTGHLEQMTIRTGHLQQMTIRTGLHWSIRALNRALVNQGTGHL